MRKIGIISDTHGYLDEKVFVHFADCDEIWHAGDIGTSHVVEQLEAFKPLKAVYGNIDGTELRKSYPETAVFMCEEVKVMIHHIAGKPYTYPAAAKKLIIEHQPGILVCGHSHILRVEFDKKLQFLYLNPGAAGVHGFHKVKTLLRFKIDGQRIFDMEAIELGPRAGKYSEML